MNSRIVRQPTRPWFDTGMRHLWTHRELLAVMTVRAITVRYRQMALGLGWVVLEPLALLALMAIVFGGLLNLPSEGYPYPVFVFSGLVPYMLFDKVLKGSAESLTQNMSIISKISFPRLLLPVSTALRDASDTAVATVLLVGLAMISGISLNLRMLFVGVGLAIAGIAGLAVGTLLSVVLVKFRDVRHVLTIGSQAVMYGTPIIYSADIVPPSIRWLYDLNPIYWATEFTRAGMLDRPMHVSDQLFLSVLVVGGIGVVGLLTFARFERLVVDVQ